MNKLLKLFLFLFVVATTSTALVSCEGDDGVNGIDGQNGKDGVDGDDGEDFVPLPTMFSNKSATKPLVALAPQFNFVEAYSIISTPDVIGTNFQLAGSADGAGFLKDGTGYMYVVNCEDSYAVARIRLDQNLKPISGDYLLNSGVSDFARQCSGTMWEKEI